MISGNGSVGLSVGGISVLIEGNWTGTDRSGEVALGNGGAGIRLTGVTTSTIGGTVLGSRNIISANKGDGISLGTSYLSTFDSDHDLIEGNLIGTDGTGKVAFGNTGYGITTTGTGNTIGGTALGAGNVISGNTSGGVRLLQLIRADGARIRRRAGRGSRKLHRP